MESRSTALNIKWRCNSLMLSKHSEQRLQPLQWSTEGSTNAFCEKVKRPANEKTALGNHGNCGFGSCHWQPQRVESVLGEQKEAISQSEVCGFRDKKSWKTNQN